MNNNEGGAGQSIKLLHGDCLDEMRKLDSDSVDSIITDPPYGISFMSQKWDKSVPTVEIWQEALRVLKPGGTALIFTGCRLSHRMVCNIEDAGFIIFNKIMWCYGTGFSKSYNISKGMDKYHGVEREVVGRNKNSRENCTIENTIYESGTVGKTDYITKPATDDAIMWDGWGTDIAPAYEEIIMARKPNYINNVENALKYGVAGLNIDGARIAIDENSKHKIGNKVFSKEQSISVFGSNGGKGVALPLNEKGRFPKNMILDEVAVGLIDEQSGQSKSGDRKINTTNNCKDDGQFMGGLADKKPCRIPHNDKGGASRYFKVIDKYKGIPLNSRLLYIPRASKAERNRGCESLETKMRNTLGDFPQDEKMSGGKNYNSHSTVKPILLMEYLCMLTKTPFGGTVLDPFCGSGSTGIGCVNTERSFIGIDLEAEYLEIARLRIKQAELDYQPQLFEA